MNIIFRSIETMVDEELQIRTASESEPSNTPLLRIAFLASHNGTDMRAIIEAIASGTLQATPVLLISNNSDAPVIEYVKEESPIPFPTYHISTKTAGSVEAVDEQMAHILKENTIDIVVACGYMKHIGPKTIKAFCNRILNVHPSLLPDLEGYWGNSIYDAIFARRALHPNHKPYNQTGVTIHWVDIEYDRGEHVLQRAIPIADEDTPQTLKEKIQKLEAQMYIQVLQTLQQEKQKYKQSIAILT